MRRSLFSLALGVVVCLGLAPGDAAAQSGAILRNSSRNIQRNIDNQIAQALRPRLVVRNAIAGGVTGLAGGGSTIVALHGDASARVWDLVSGIETAVIGDVPVTRVAVSDDGRRIALGFRDGRVRLQSRNGNVQAEFPAHRSEVRLLAVTPDGVVSAAADGVRQWTPAGQPVRDLGRPDQVGIAVNGARLALAARSGAVEVLDLGSGTVLATIAGSTPAAALAFADADTLLVGAGGAVTAHRIGQGAPAWSVDAGSGVTALAALPDRRVAVGGTDGKVRAFQATDGAKLGETEGRHGAAAAGVLPMAGGKLVLSASSDGLAELWEVPSLKTRARLISTQRGWAVIDRDGRYDGSLGGADDVAWQLDSAVLPVDNFSRAYYEPALLAKIVRPGAAFATAPKPLDDGVMPLPTATVSAAPSGTPDEMLVTVGVDDKGGGIGGVRLTLNSRPLDAAQQVQRDEGDKRWTLVYRVPGVPGDNVVAAIPQARDGVEGEAATTNFTVAAAPAAPVLHVAAVAINDYVNPADRLGYAVPDAQAVGAALKTHAPYQRVDFQLLSDTQATKANILAMFRQLGDIPAQDVVVVYLAGHGGLVDERWHFIPYDVANVADPAQIKAKALTAEELRGAMAGIKARKVVLLIDACRSGAALSDVSLGLDRRDLKEVGRSSGVHLIAATQKDQDAIEFEQLGHGAFTYVALRALEHGEAGPGETSARQLLTHLERTVPPFLRQQLEKLLASMAQRGAPGPELDTIPIPVPMAFSQGSDFPIAKAAAKPAVAAPAPKQARARAAK